MIATTIMSSIRVKPPCRRETGLHCCCIVVPCLADVEAVVETVGVMFSIVPSVVSLFMLMLSLRSRCFYVHAIVTFVLSLHSFRLLPERYVGCSDGAEACRTLPNRSQAHACKDTQIYHG